jgi:hypothetical protein
VSLGHSFNLKLTRNHFWHHPNWQELVDNEELIVWHEPIIDEYWGRFEEEIDTRRQVDIVDICDIYIENVEITKERLAALVAMFVSGRATNSSTYTSFSNANLCEEGIISLSKLVETSSMLKIFSLCHNRIDNMESVRRLSRSLKSHARINTLSLAHCDLGSSPEILLVILQSEVKYINLEHNNIDSLGVVKVAQYLEGDPSIDGISLQYNRSNDDDALLISQALKRNTNLTHLNLLGNNLTSTGVKALLTCVFDSSSLNAISESNHTLERMNVFDYNNKQFKRLQGCIDRLLEFNRTQKIMLALQDKDSLLQYLANVPVGLIPQVMAFPLRRDDNQLQHEYLNVLYSTMRWWNMPMLYSYHHAVPSLMQRGRENKSSDAKRKNRDESSDAKRNLQVDSCV